MTWEVKRRSKVHEKNKSVPPSQCQCPADDVVTAHVGLGHVRFISLARHANLRRSVCVANDLSTTFSTSCSAPKCNHGSCFMDPTQQQPQRGQHAKLTQVCEFWMCHPNATFQWMCIHQFRFGRQQDCVDPSERKYQPFEESVGLDPTSMRQLKVMPVVLSFFSSC